MIPPRIALLVCLALGVLASPAHAGNGGRSYAVVAMEISGDADPNLRAEVAAGLARGVEEVGGTVLGYDEVQKRLAGKPALIGCLSTTCLASIAEVVGTSDMIRVRIAANGANYEVELELLGTGGLVRKRAGSCTVCTTTDLSDLTATRVHELLTAEELPVAVEIATEPADATLEITGLEPQTAPWKGSLPPGTYEVTARRDGYEPRTQTLEVKDDGKPQALTIQLALATGDTPPPGRWGWKKYAIGGAGAAALITGIVLLALDGNPTCDAPNATCPEEYATGPTGIVLGVVGLAGAGVSGWMFWSERKDRQESAAIAPTRGGAVATFSIRF
jgi:hypothetical protein